MSHSKIPLNIELVTKELAPMNLLLEADPDSTQVLAYLQNSLCFVARKKEEVLGVYVLQEQGKALVELKNIAVAPARQGQGIGQILLEHAIAQAQALGAKQLWLGTGTFGYQLTFYQRAGFRLSAIEKDYFTENYPEPIIENGIQHRDRLLLTLDFPP